MLREKRTGADNPSIGGNILMTLAQIEENQEARVLDIQGGCGIRRKLGHLGIHPGDLVRVVRHGPWGGPILMEVHGYQIALGKMIASRILVEAEK
jgi:ferrous iron transport protein A